MLLRNGLCLLESGRQLCSILLSSLKEGFLETRDINLNERRYLHNIFYRLLGTANYLPLRNHYSNLRLAFSPWQSFNHLRYSITKSCSIIWRDSATSSGIYHVSSSEKIQIICKNSDRQEVFPRFSRNIPRSILCREQVSNVRFQTCKLTEHGSGSLYPIHP